MMHQIDAVRGACHWIRRGFRAIHQGDSSPRRSPEARQYTGIKPSPTRMIVLPAILVD